MTVLDDVRAAMDALRNPPKLEAPQIIFSPAQAKRVTDAGYTLDQVRSNADAAAWAWFGMSYDQWKATQSWTLS